MAPPAKENLPPKKRKENRPPVEVRNDPDCQDSLSLLSLLTITNQQTTSPPSPSVEPEKTPPPRTTLGEGDGENVEMEETPSPVGSPPPLLIANPVALADYYRYI